MKIEEINRGLIGEGFECIGGGGRVGGRGIDCRPGAGFVGRVGCRYGCTTDWLRGEDFELDGRGGVLLEISHSS